MDRLLSQKLEPKHLVGRIRKEAEMEEQQA
jgi:hypothetical protein